MRCTIVIMMISLSTFTVFDNFIKVFDNIIEKTNLFKLQSRTINKPYLIEKNNHQVLITYSYIFNSWVSTSHFVYQILLVIFTFFFQHSPSLPFMYIIDYHFPMIIPFIFSYSHLNISIYDIYTMIMPPIFP